jgi:hypothetical protein
LTSIDRTTEPEISVRRVGWITAVTSLLSVITVAILAFTGQTEAAAVAAVAGGAVAGVKVTVNIRR